MGAFVTSTLQLHDFDLMMEKPRRGALSLPAPLRQGRPMNDFQFAMRSMQKSPLFSGTVVMTAALAIGASITMFSVVNAVLLRPLPFSVPDRIVQVAEKNDKLNLPSFGSSVLNFLSWREQARSFEELAAVGFANYTLTGSGDPEQVSGNLIGPALTRVLGVTQIAGRAFSDEEENPGAAPVAMIGEGLWKRRFASDPGLVGRVIRLNGVATTVVGIAPASLNLISGGEMYTPLTIDPGKEIRLNHVVITFGRIKPGVSLKQAESEMDSVSARMGLQFPEIHDWGIRLITLTDTFVSPQLRAGVLVLLAAVLFVLLIACANIANILLARALSRRTEIGVRRAMGASRARLIRQMLVESLVLCCSGGVLGLLMALGSARLLNKLLPVGTLPAPVVEMDARIALFAVAITVMTSLLFGAAPAWQGSRSDLNDLIKPAGRGVAGGAGARLRRALASFELAMATLLLIGAGLLIRSLANLERVQLGFTSHGLITFQLGPPTSKYPVIGKGPLLYRSLLEAFQSIPGVRGGSVSSGIPFGAGNYTRHPMFTTGISILRPSTLVPIDWRIVSPGYFKVMNIPLLRGRDFTDADDDKAPHVLIVSEATAKTFWGDQDPIGRVLRRSADPNTPFTVIGVVGNVRDTALNQKSPALYYPAAARVAALMDLVVRTDQSPASLLPAIRQKVAELDTELALANVRTMDEWVSNSAAQPRMNAVLLSVFAFLALLIASIGIYGVLAYSVSERTGEIGLRMALGASPSDILRMVAGEGMRVTVAGIGLGLVGALLLERVLSSLIYDVSARDPATYTLGPTLLAVVALAACILPALRAARVLPMVALRHE
jgi:putative ABC transport system permease protein